MNINILHIQDSLVKCLLINLKKNRALPTCNYILPNN